MSSVVNVAIHSSQSPDNVRRDLLASLRSRRVNHKFHYDSIKQTNRWLALHQAHSPSRNDLDCAATYDRAFVSAAKTFSSRTVQLIGLGCGGGQKDTRLLKQLKSHKKSIIYTPSDVSVGMTLVARQAALSVLPSEKISPLVCDLTTTDDLPRFFNSRHTSRASRLITFFGMIPNFEPDEILPKLNALMRRGDSLLFSANLAPGSDYAAGVRNVLPQYDNDLTSEWLLSFLLDLGVERGDGRLRFDVEHSAGGLLRIVARFRFRKARTVIVEGHTFDFRIGETMRLFFSYRYTPKSIRNKLAKHGLLVRDQWITKSEEEGVFLCRRK